MDGFLRRIMKLLFFGIKPVFVFDGQTPALKKKTLDERRKARSKLYGQEEVNYKKAAERLLEAVVQDQLHTKIHESKSKESQSSKKKAKKKLEEKDPLMQRGFDPTHVEELESEIKIDYMADQCEQITQLL